MSKSYQEKLQVPRWKKFSETVKNHYGNKCWSCGSEENLQSHHKFYKSNSDVWDYKLEDMICLCGNCHELLHQVKKNSDSEFETIEILEFAYFRLNELGSKKVNLFMQNLSEHIFTLKKQQLKNLTPAEYEKAVRELAKKWRV